MIKKLICLGTILTIYCIICHEIYTKNIIINKEDIITSKKPTYIVENDQIGYLKIDKINLFQPLLKKESIHNNIEENVTILKDSIMPTEKNSIVFLAAHSGSGSIAFFKDLNKLEVGDIIELKYKNQIYHYQINNIWEARKNGYIHVNKTKLKQLILTTCSPEKENKQLIINSNII